jgi:phage terminase large subunit
MGFEYVYRELHKSDLIASKAAKQIVELSIYDDGSPEEIEKTFAPPDLWSRTKDSGRDIAGLFSENGVRFTKASPERVAGWQLVKEHLRSIASLDGEGTTPRLRVFRNCHTLIKHLQMLEFDDKRTSDAATEPHEITHRPDALRYFSVFYFRPGESPDSTPRRVWTKDMWEDYYNASESGKEYLIRKYGKPK